MEVPPPRTEPGPGPLAEATPGRSETLDGATPVLLQALTRRSVASALLTSRGAPAPLIRTVTTVPRPHPTTDTRPPDALPTAVPTRAGTGRAGAEASVYTVTAVGPVAVTAPTRSAQTPAMLPTTANGFEA